MKPHRVRMANSLVLHYGLYSKLDGVRCLLGHRPRGLQRAPGVHTHARSFAPTLLRPTPCLQYYTPTRAGPEDMAAFHASDYVDFLRTVTPDNQARAGPCGARLCHGEAAERAGGLRRLAPLRLPLLAAASLPRSPSPPPAWPAVPVQPGAAPI